MKIGWNFLKALVAMVAKVERSQSNASSELKPSVSVIASCDRTPAGSASETVIYHHASGDAIVQTWRDADDTNERLGDIHPVRLSTGHLAFPMPEDLRARMTESMKPERRMEGTTEAMRHYRRLRPRPMIIDDPVRDMIAYSHTSMHSVDPTQRFIDAAKRFIDGANSTRKALNELREFLEEEGFYSENGMDEVREIRDSVGDSALSEAFEEIVRRCQPSDRRKFPYPISLNSLCIGCKYKSDSDGLRCAINPVLSSQSRVEHCEDFEARSGH